MDDRQCLPAPSTTSTLSGIGLTQEANIQLLIEVHSKSNKEFDAFILLEVQQKEIFLAVKPIHWNGGY